MGPAAGDDKTRISAPSVSKQKIPARYQASVVIVQGYAEGMEYSVDRTYAVIGRNKDAAVPLRDPLASREHAVIVYHDGVFVLKDLDSTNGTHMRGASIRQRKLRHGDKFRVGDTVLQFILQDSGRARTYEIA
ncbi:MAG: FHA domain-containing protein [Nitrospirae bacterium]|jgi:pilus assembly protein CpaF|nr:FHA domain-containing protein [Nitrospirota bacterium]NTW66870.1 FHA domain-containing protein [Nitrospirota bacterium]